MKAGLEACPLKSAGALGSAQVPVCSSGADGETFLDLILLI